jgi:hypothetical protein
MGKKHALPILSIVRAGPSQFERFQIADDKDRLWTGTAFGPTGILYATHNAAATDIQLILKGHFTGVEPVRYVAPIFIEVFSHEALPVAVVAKHLSRASRLYLNTPEHGNGPGSSLVLPWIEWHRIQERGPNDDE